MQKPKIFLQQLPLVNGSPPSWENLCAIIEAGEVKKVITACWENYHIILSTITC